MEKIEKSVAIVAKVLGIIVFIVAAIFGGVSLMLTCVNDDDESKNLALLWLLATYMLILIGIALYKYCIDDKIKCGFSIINFHSFVLHCQVVPLLFVSVGLIMANVKEFKAYIHLIIIICTVIQCGITFLWFWKNLRKSEELKNSDLLKLDLYSTVVVLLLTIIWVLYDIGRIKFAFAIMLGTFMVLQVMIKRKSIILAEKEENKIGK